MNPGWKDPPPPHLYSPRLALCSRIWSSRRHCCGSSSPSRIRNRLLWIDRILILLFRVEWTWSGSWSTYLLPLYVYFLNKTTVLLMSFSLAKITFLFFVFYSFSSGDSLSWSWTQAANFQILIQTPVVPDPECFGADLIRGLSLLFSLEYFNMPGKSRFYYFFFSTYIRKVKILNLYLRISFCATFLGVDGRLQILTESNVSRSRETQKVKYPTDPNSKLY